MVTGRGDHGYHSADRRPWLIISRSEAIALQQAALGQLASSRGLRPLPTVLARALRVIDLQLRFIDGAADGLVPNKQEAVLREEGKWDA